MNAVILAAGTGSRLYPLTKDIPKSLIPLGDGITIFETEIKTLRKSPLINNIYFVTGYKAEKIEEKIKELKMEKIFTLYNPFFELTNNLASVWIARSVIEKNDCILSNGDNLFHYNIIEKLTHDRRDIVVSIIRKKHYVDDDMKVTTINDKLKSISKELNIDESNGESIGIIRIAGKGRTAYLSALECLVRKKEYLNKFHLEIIQHLINQGYPVYYQEFSEKDWTEMDFHPDVDIIKKNLNWYFK